MRDFAKLVHFEVRRFRHILFGLMGLTAVIQLGMYLYWLLMQVSLRQDGGSSLTDMPFSFADAIKHVQAGIIFSILISIGTIGFYIFFIWYRDWVGRDTFIYRLLMLPSKRGYLYVSKLTALLIFIFSLLGCQVVLVVLYRFIYGWAVPERLQEPSLLTDAFRSNEAWEVVLPVNFDHFLVYYGLGILGVLVVFTCILLERSYRFIGILYGILYAFVSFLAVVWPIVFLRPASWHAQLYPNEAAVIQLAMCALVAGVSVWLGIRLLNKKITV